MQATIRYLLSEQAQRAQMAATGQPVAREQVIIIDITAEDLPLCNIAPDGAITVDVARSHAPALRCAGWQDGNPIQAAIPNPDVLPDIRRGRKILEEAYTAACAAASQYVIDTSEREMEHPEQAYFVHVPHVALGGKCLPLDVHPSIDHSRHSEYGIKSCDLSDEAQATMSARYRATVARINQESSDAVDRWMADPTLRLKPTYRGVEIIIFDTRVTAARYDELWAEIARRNALDDAAKQRVEDAKTEAIAAYVASSGDPMLIEQYEDGLVARKRLVGLMANAALDAAGLPAECNATVCQDSDCPCGDESVESIPPAAYAVWHPIKRGLPDGYSVEFRRVRSCRHLEQWEEDEDRAGATEYHARVTIPSGPFEFTRRIKL